MIEAKGQASAVLYDLVRAVNGDTSPYVPPGLVGSFLNRDRTSERRSAFEPYLSQVSLDLVDVTIGQALDELVRQAPGLGWAVQERLAVDTTQGRNPIGPRSLRCNVVLFAGDSWSDSSDHIDPGPDEATEAPNRLPEP
jgi:hypothetical protein